MTGGTTDPILQPMTQAHLAGALRLSREAGWPHRYRDWALLLSMSQGFVVTSAGGEVLGTAMRTPFGPVSMANMIIVDQALRGRGIGRRLLQAVLDLAPSDEWRLVATPEGLPLYESLGFVETGTVRQYQGELPMPAAAPPQDGPDAPAARWVDAPDAGLLERIVRLDRQAHGADRRAFFAAIAGTARLAVVEGPAGPAAAGFLRVFGRGLSLAPLIARDRASAAAIVRLAAQEAAERFLRIDTISAPGADCPLAPSLAAIGLSLADSGVAMTRPAPDTTTPRPSGDYYRFALASQALG